MAFYQKANDGLYELYVHVKCKFDMYNCKLDRLKS